MRLQFLVATLLVGSLASTALAQTPTRGTPSRTLPKVLPRPSPSGSQPAHTSFLVGGADDCSNAGTNAIAGVGTFTVDTTVATDSPQIGTGCVQAHRDVWFQWTSTYTGAATLTLCGGTTDDTVIAVWTGSACPSGTPLACDDDSSCGLQSQVTFPVTNGNVYLLQIGVYGANVGFSGTFNIVQPPPPPANDDCSTPTVLSGAGPFPFDNTMATTGLQGQNEPICNLFSSTAVQNDVWFTWTAPATGLATFATCGLTTVDTKIAVYPGAGCPTNGSALACNDDNCAGTFQSSVDFPVTSGQQYTLEIGTYPGALGGTGSFSIGIPPPPPPPIPASLNVDIGSPVSTYGVPTSAYGAAAALPGYWNARDVSISSAQLNDLTGAPSGCVLTRTGTTLNDFEYPNPGPTGDDQKLMDDAQDIGGAGGTTTWTFSNLFGGNYTIYTYAWAPDVATYTSVVSVAGSTDPAQTVGGTWSGTQTLGVTYAVHHVAGVPNTGSIAITVATGAGFGTLNGFQIVETSSPYVGYCFGDGTGTACPCGNTGAAGNGCGNSVNANGANLAASGVASVGADTLVLTGTGMPNSSCLYFQGTTQISTVFGDGLRCAGGQVFRLGTELNSGGGSQYPNPGEFPVSVRGFVPVGGGIRTYQCWYRNPASFCTPSTFNLSNGVQVTWTP